MQRRKNRGFSLLEVIAAVVILAVVAAATVATVAPMRAKSEDKLAEQEIASLNAMAQTYFLEVGSFPRNVNDLVREGYLSNADAAARDRIRKISRNYTYTRSTGTFTQRS
ncbi:MAG: prepilin-type N-terminal cleavage/methylation domain-containing protein [Planctomycetota bacterium]